MSLRRARVQDDVGAMRRAAMHPLDGGGHLDELWPDPNDVDDSRGVGKPSNHHPNPRRSGSDRRYVGPTCCARAFRMKHIATGRGRRPLIDALLADDLAAWKAALAAAGYPTASDDCLLRGDFGGHGVPDGHDWKSGAQVAGQILDSGRSQGRRRVAGRAQRHHRATPYSLRRGIISLRIRAGEDRQAIAKQCCTSVDMMARNYSFAIEDFEYEGPKPAVEERLRARRLALAGRRRLLRVARAMLEVRADCQAVPCGRYKHELGFPQAAGDQDLQPRAARNRAANAEDPGDRCKRPLSSAGRALPW